MIAGEGLAGVAIAFLVAAKGRWPEAAWSRQLGAWHFAERGFAYLDGSGCRGRGRPGAARGLRDALPRRHAGVLS